jgi:hypothetical protein
VLKRLETARVELQKSAGADVRAILDGVVTTLSLLKDGFTIWTAAVSAYSIGQAAGSRSRRQRNCQASFRAS